MHKYICNTMETCAVYVFGSSTQGVCPGCGNEGERMNQISAIAFVKWFQRVVTYSKVKAHSR